MLQRCGTLWELLMLSWTGCDAGYSWKTGSPHDMSGAVYDPSPAAIFPYRAAKHCPGSPPPQHKHKI